MDDKLYKHNAEGKDDMPAHIKSALTNNQISLSLKNGELFLGTWQGIYLFPLSIDNEVNWAIIKNSRLGIQADTINPSASSNPTLTIRNSMIYNCSSIGISGRGSWIEGSNCVFANCGDYCGAFSLGGNYTFKLVAGKKLRWEFYKDGQLIGKESCKALYVDILPTVYPSPNGQSLLLHLSQNTGWRWDDVLAVVSLTFDSKGRKRR